MAPSRDTGGVVERSLDLGSKLLTSLPPAFLLLVAINVAFLGCVMWFLNNQSAERSALVQKLMDRCMDIALHAEPPGR